MAAYRYFSEGQLKIDPTTGTKCRTGQLNHQFVEQKFVGGVWVGIGDNDGVRYGDVAGAGCCFREGIRNGDYVVDVETEIAGFLLAEGVGWVNCGSVSGYYWNAQNKPSGLTLTLISGGVKLDWTDNSLGTGQTEIWGRSDAGISALLYTIAAGIVTKSETITPVDLRYYKLRGLKGGQYSVFTTEASVVMLGSNLFRNGTFDSSEGLVTTGGLAISGGKVNFDREIANGSILSHVNDGSNEIRLVEGKYYNLKFDISDRTIPIQFKGFRDYILGTGFFGAPFDAINDFTNGSHEYILPALHSGVEITNAIMGFTCYGGANPGGSFKIDNISIQEVNPHSFDRGKLCITFDGNYSSLYTNGLPLLQAKGAKATYYSWSDGVGTSGMYTWANIAEILADGMDMQCHTKDHVRLTTLTEVDLLANLQAVNDVFVANGLPVPEHIAYPWGSYSNNVKSWVSGLRQTGRAFNYPSFKQYYPQYKDLDKYEICCLMIDHVNLIGEYGAGCNNSMDLLKIKIQDAAHSRGVIVVAGHEVTNDGAGSSIKDTELEEIIDFARANDMDILTVSELHGLLE